MLKTLYGKLAVSFFALLLLLGTLYIGLTFWTTRLFLMEVNQKLNRSLANHMVTEKILISDGKANNEALKEIFHMLMVINPTIEVYLLDPQGTLLAFSAPPGKVKRKQISLQPIHQFLNQETNFPLLGDDPRGKSRQKVFSVAPIFKDNELQGYLYVILGGEAFDSTAQMLQGSYILKLSTWALMGGIFFILVAGLLIFNLLTRRLTRLTHGLEEFQRGNFLKPLEFPAPLTTKSGDEIDRLGSAFHEMAQRIQIQMNKLKEIDSLRRQLVANVSHDLRTPLAALQGYLETLHLKEGKLSPEEQREYLEIATRHCERLGKLISELFELARLDSHETQPHLEPFSICELVQDVVQKFKLASEKKGVHIQTNLDQELPFVYADIGLIERVLGNLIENALRFTPEAGTISIQLSKTDKRFNVKANGEITIEVSDTGCGIPPEEIPYIFHRFYRATQGNASGGEGSGLGLAITKRIMELHGTSMAVKSQINQGTTFSFHLPVSKI